MANILNKVKSCKPLLLMLLVCIDSLIKSVLRYKFLILDTYHPDTLYLCELGMRICSYFSKMKGGQKQKVWETLL